MCIGAPGSRPGSRRPRTFGRDPSKQPRNLALAVKKLCRSKYLSHIYIVYHALPGDDASRSSAPKRAYSDTPPPAQPQKSNLHLIYIYTVPNSLTPKTERKKKETHHHLTSKDAEPTQSQPTGPEAGMGMSCVAEIPGFGFPPAAAYTDIS